MLTILDEYTRECHVLRADRALKSADVLEWMGKAIADHGAPEYLRSDNGSEFIAKEVQHWLAENQIKTIFNREQLWTLTEARVVIEDCRRDYNQHRPHSKLGYLSPAGFATNQSAPSSAPEPSGLLTPKMGKPKQSTNLDINTKSSD